MKKIALCIGLQFFFQWTCLVHAEVALDVNDVSLLLPLKEGRPYPAIPLASSGLISNTLFEQVLLFENPDKHLSELPYSDVNFLTDLSTWFVTSIRVDDCGDNFHQSLRSDPSRKDEFLVLEKAQGCQPRLRLVAQPFNASKQPLPTALHLLFQLNTEQIRLAYSYLEQIKLASNNTTGVPLSIHPGLLQEASGSKIELADLVQQFIFSTLKLAGPSPLEQLSLVTLTLNTQILAWKMVGGLVEQGHWKRFVTQYNQKFYEAQPTLPFGIESIRCNFYEFCGVFPNTDAVDLEQDNTLSPILKFRADGKLKAPMRSALSEIQSEKIDDPSKTNFFNTNCISCHESSNFRNRDRLLSAFSFPQGITPFVLKKYLSDRPSTIINFGYEGVSPQISTRVASESAVVADRINRARGLGNPARPVSDYSSLWNCLVNSDDFQKCF